MAAGRGAGARTQQRTPIGGGPARRTLGTPADRGAGRLAAPARRRPDRRAVRGAPGEPAGAPRRRGVAAPGRGWAAVPAAGRVPVFQAATSEIGGLFPLLAANGVPAVGARMGYDTLSGGAFYCHPVEWLLRGLATNPNMVLFGEPGRGKSSTVVAFVLRMMLFGIRTLISGDVKGEYTPLLRALGCTPIALGRGSPARLNALDLGPLAARWDGWSAAQQREELAGVLGRWTTLLAALAETQGYPPTVTDELVLSTVLRRLLGVIDGNTRLRPVTVPDVVAAARRTGRGALAGGPVRRAAGVPRPHPLDHRRARRTWSSVRWPDCSTNRRTSPSTGTPRSSRWTCRCCAPAATRPSPSR